jgi:hypothetical protein
VEVSGGLASGGGRHHVLTFTSRNIALSSIVAANSFFSLVFSSSKPQARLGPLQPFDKAALSVAGLMI